MDECKVRKRFYQGINVLTIKRSEKWNYIFLTFGERLAFM